MNKVIVLLSSYNGEKYIEAQIDSILNQVGVEVQLIVRDDGSKDNTINILNRYQAQFDNFSWYTGANLRSAKSFMDLLYTAPEAAYYAFADQDDVWDKDKLQIAISYLVDDYVLYTCKKRIVDQNLKPLQQEDEYVRDVSLGSSILKCNVSGCTMVFTLQLRKLILDYKPHVISMHDAWVLKVATCVGKVYYDKVAHMDYRQHSNNVVGASKSSWELLKYRLQTFFRRKNDLERVIMAQQLYRYYAKYLDEKTAKQLLYFACSRKKFSYRLKTIFSNFLITQHKKDLFFIKLLVLFGLI